MGGPGGATNPEQLFAAGYAACFHSALKLRRPPGERRLTDTAVTASVGIGPTRRRLGLAVDLEVDAPSVDKATATDLVDKAHQVCPYSNATRGNVEVDLNVV